MKVKCIANLGSAIPSEQRAGYCSPETFFPVEPGETYSVYAIGNRVGSAILEFLIADASGYPRYVPSALFQVLESQLPIDFGYTEWKSEDFNYRIWGYQQILEYTHHEGLVELRQQDLEIFSRVRGLIDDRMWIPGEKEIVRSLLSNAGVKPITVPDLIAERTRNNGVVRTYFYTRGNQVIRNVKDIGSIQLEVSINDEICNALAYLIETEGIVCGWELYILDGDTPFVLRKLMIAKS
jgi:hypothetical protein